MALWIILILNSISTRVYNANLLLILLINLFFPLFLSVILKLIFPKIFIFKYFFFFFTKIMISLQCPYIRIKQIVSNLSSSVIVDTVRSTSLRILDAEDPNEFISAKNTRYICKTCRYKSDTMLMLMPLRC